MGKNPRGIGLRHIANAQIKWRIERTCVSAGYIAPVVCTPEQLMEDLR